eukprot:1157914-Pelagomonas_calceolata.AAC.5
MQQRSAYGTRCAQNKMAGLKIMSWFKDNELWQHGLDMQQKTIPQAVPKRGGKGKPSVRTSAVGQILPARPGSVLGTGSAEARDTRMTERRLKHQ